MTLRLPLLAHTLASPCFGHEPKARVTTTHLLLQIFPFGLELLAQLCQNLQLWYGYFSYICNLISFHLQYKLLHRFS